MRIVLLVDSWTALS